MVYFRTLVMFFFVSHSLIQCWVGTTDNQRETREKRKKTKQRITVCGRAACFLISFQLYYLKLCWKNHSSLSPALTALHVQSHGCQHCVKQSKYMSSDHTCVHRSLPCLFSDIIKMWLKSPVVVIMIYSSLEAFSLLSPLNHWS